MPKTTICCFIISALMLQWIIKIQQEDINDEKNVLKILFLKKAHDHIKFMLYFSKVL